MTNMILQSLKSTDQQNTICKIKVHLSMIICTYVGSEETTKISDLKI